MDHYHTLKVPRNASQEQIRQSFRRLARECHPDLNKSPLAESRFKTLNLAYEILGDPVRRAEYDEEHLALRREGVMHTRPNPATWARQAPENTGESPPRPGKSRQEGAAPRANPAPGPTARPYSFGQQPRPATDKPPAGEKSPRNPFRMFSAGKKLPPEPEEEPLEIRLALSLEEAAQGGPHDITLNLPELGGIRTFQVRVPPGSMAGQKIRIKGERHLDLVVELLPHARFRLEGRDLHLPIPVTPWEAALGCRLEVPTLTGRVVAHIPANSSSGRKVLLRGQGFPARLGETPGDLLIELRLVLPARLSEEESRLFAKLAAISSFNPRA